MEICDIHHHLGAFHGGCLIDQDGWTDVDYDARVAMMTHNDINYVCLLASAGYLQADGIHATRRSNDVLAEYQKRDPSRFPVAAGIVEPLHGAASLDEIDRIKHDLHLNGIVWHHRFQGVFLDDPLMRPILHRMGDLDLVAFIHTNGESNIEAAWRLERLAQEFPDVSFVAMDAFGGGNSNSLMAIEIAKRNHNIVWDTSGLSKPDLVRRFVGQAGSEKLVLGKTYYSSPPSYWHNRTIDIIQDAGLDTADLANIYHNNVRRIFNLGVA